MSTLAAAVRYRALIDRLGAIVWEAIPGRRPGEATFTFVSEGTEPLLGYTPEHWMADKTFWFEMIEPEDRERVNAEIVGCVVERRGGDFEYRARAADGRLVWLRNIVQLDEGSADSRMTGVLIDITGRKTAEARLVRLQELTDALSGAVTPPEVCAVVAERGRDAVGAAAVAVFLGAGDELELAAFDGRGDPADHRPVASEAIRSGTEVRRGDLVALPLTDGERVLGATVLRLAEGVSVASEDRLVLDVLERVTMSALLRAEQAAAERDSRAVLDTIIRTAPEGFALFDTSLRYVRVNDALAAINGVPADEHPGRTLAEIVPDLPSYGHAEPLRQVLATGEPVLDIEVTGVTRASPDDQRTWLVSYYPVRAADGEIGWLGCFVVDITQRKRAEERARLLGELSALLDAAVSVDARMVNLVDALVPELCSFASVALRGPGGGLERAASRGSDEPALTVPLRVRGRELGELAMTFAGPVPDADDRAFATEVAQRAALAIDNAHLYEAERVARERSASQYAVAARLAEALSAADVARTTLDEILPALGATQGTMWQLDDEGAMLDIIGYEGFTADQIAGYEQAALSDERPTSDAARTGRLVLVSDEAEIVAAYPGMGPAIVAGGLRTIAVFPLTTPGRVVGVLFISSEQPHAFGPDDIALGTALAAQAAQALDRARLFEAERRISVTLQRSLLPATLPEVAGLEIDLRYLPAAGLEAGGDFYEAVSLADGSVLVAVGDVVGRGATAAAAMGQLRSALRAFALAGEGPARILERLSAFADTVPEAMAATAVVAKLDPASGRLEFACAGHPWPLLVHADGSALFLQGGRGVPLGCLPEPQFEEAEVHLDPDATLVLYTDGLTERRSERLDVVMERVRAAAAAAAGEPLAALLDGAVAAAGGDAQADDVALVALRYTGAGAVERLSFPAVPDEVPVARHAVREWLARHGVVGPAAGDLLLASGEAVANAVEHSGSDRVEVDLTTTPAGWFAIVVRDFGRWRDPVVSPNRGRGFGLMRALAHECAVERGADGTVVRLTHRVEPDAAPVTASERPVACTVTVGDDGVARLAGDLDLASAAGVAERLAVGDFDLIDLSAVTHLDSTGARMLFELPARPALIAGPDTPSRRVLELSGLAGVMDVRDHA